MKKTAFNGSQLAAAAIVAAIALPASLALAAVAAGDYAGKTEAEIAESLKQQGYEVRKVESEDGYLEAYALQEGARYEIYIDPASGKVVQIKQDD